ncbi:hypothetical protein GA0074695_4210 [Micromonospora viridifaciens]|uniref:Uncharacterized protein n=1 Tax=Micromonospora viridifaciens TaxID=1881 RepID=A0A1C4YF56_MICVI|nr:hypothetical protein GA0074695_4210 [Micromonospora viridifaciens]
MAGRSGSRAAKIAIWRCIFDSPAVRFAHLIRIS